MMMHKLLVTTLATLIGIAPLVAVGAAERDDAWARVTLSADSDRSQLPASAVDYGGFAWMPAADLPASLKSRAELNAYPFRMLLGERRFDPAGGLPEGDDPWFHGVAALGADYRLVQFRGPVQPQWLDALRAAGVEPVQYVHPFGYIVWADRSALDGARSLPELRFAGEFLPAFRVPEQSRLSQSSHGQAMALVHRDSAAAVTAAIAASGVAVLDSAPMGSRFALLHLGNANPSRYLDLARIAGVYTVQEITQDAGPRGEMSNQSIVGGYDENLLIFPGYLDWLTPTGLDGQGVTVGIVDGGIRTTHQDLASRMVPCVSAGGSPTSCTSSNNDHGTHVAGAVAGTGASGVTNAAGFLRGQGVAPGASLVQQRYPAFLGAGPGGMVPDGMLTIFEESARSGALLTNNSWGPSTTPQGYNIPTMHIDMISRDANPDLAGAQPVLAVWSIMNGNGDSGGACAPSSLGAPDEAKNLLAVGSTKLQNSNGTQIADIFDVSANSAHGPACDGRLVPHIVAPGCRTDSTDSAGNTAFALACGTSMASPVASGAVALFIEQYRKTHAVDPSPALVKAVFTATAMDLQGFRNADNQVMGHRPDRFQGWGRLDLDRIINPQVSVRMLDQDLLFTSAGQDWSATFAPSDPDQPMRIMLAWTDAPGAGTGGTTPAWVNDLDLRAEAGAQTYRGNHFDSNGFSAVGGSADPRNNLEGIMLSPAQHGGGPVSVTVLAANIAGDAIDPWNPSSPRQDFALACINCAEDPDFTLAVAPDEAAICVPGGAGFDIDIGSLLGFNGPVTLGTDGLPAGVQATFGSNPVVPPGTSTLDIVAPPGTSPFFGSFAVTADASTGSKQRAVALSLADAAPAMPLPLSPADGASGIPAIPTLSWSTAAQAASYLVEVASDAAFNDIVFEVVTADTSVDLDVELDPGTNYWWRVHASNACDTVSSVAFTFRTQPLPGDCDIGTEANLVWAQDFNDGSGGFVAGGSGAGGWTLSTARPSPVSGGNAFFAPNPAATSDRHLSSPPIQLPADELPLTLIFQNWREIERDSGTSCWDAGVLEISVDGGAFVAVETGDLLDDPYTGTVRTGTSNVLGGRAAWCDEPPRAWADTRVDLSAHAGAEVTLRWRLASDSIVGREGWYVDDVRVQSCTAGSTSDLGVDKSVDADVAVHGSNVVFTIAATNVGPADATGVVVVDQLPSGYTFVGASASVGSYDEGTGVWTIGDLAASDDATLDITATVEDNGEYQNIAIIAGDQADPNAANDSSSATVIAIGPNATDLSITKDVDATGVAIGATVVFTLTAANDGPGNATDVEVQDLLPPGYSFVSAHASQGSYDENTGQWAIGGMHPAETATLEITATVNLIDAWVNTATVSGAQDDPFPGNNSDSASAAPDVSLDVFADGFE